MTECAQRFTGFMHRLYKAQGGLCFHCDEHMTQGNAPGSKGGLGANREHVFPHSSTGRDLVHNIVLAHVRCNKERGNREPSAAEIAKAARIYKLLGIEPFVTKAAYDAKHGSMRRWRRT